ncbi:MAG: cyclic nucleotide-binding domain-containing protein [SAR324 cluster bacterium]|nr:cyclic nucleotide-binding domain-containing protein [SAR324 cluster bacterium]
MKTPPVKIPDVADKDRTPLVNDLLAVIDSQKIKIKKLQKYAAKSRKVEIEDPKRQNIYNVIKDKRSFGQMPDEMLRRLVKNMKVLRLKKGAIVLTQGEPSSFVYLMLRGRVSVIVDGKLVYAFQRLGDIFGEMSFLNQTVCSATIRAESDLELMVISTKSLNYIGNEDFYFWLCRILSDKLNRTSKQLSSSNDKSEKSSTETQKPQEAPEKAEAKPEEKKVPEPEISNVIDIEEEEKAEAKPEEKKVPEPEISNVIDIEEEEKVPEPEEEMFVEEAIEHDIPDTPDDFFGPD